MRLPTTAQSDLPLVSVMTKTTHTPNSVKRTIWLVYKVEFDGMENDLDRAICKKLLGWVATETEASDFVMAQKDKTYTGWDSGLLSWRKNVTYPYYECIEVEQLDPQPSPEGQQPGGEDE